MIIKVPKTILEDLDIGPLDGFERLPMLLRKKYHLVSICAFCQLEIEEDFFIAGFKKGRRNMMFHVKCFEAQNGNRS